MHAITLRIKRFASHADCFFKVSNMNHIEKVHKYILWIPFFMISRYEFRWWDDHRHIFLILCKSGHVFMLHLLDCSTKAHYKMRNLSFAKIYFFFIMTSSSNNNKIIIVIMCTLGTYHNMQQQHLPSSEIVTSCADMFHWKKISEGIETIYGTLLVFL